MAGSSVRRGLLRAALAALALSACGVVLLLGRRLYQGIVEFDGRDTAHSPAAARAGHNTQVQASVPTETQHVYSSASAISERRVHHGIEHYTRLHRPPSRTVNRIVYVDIGANEADTLTLLAQHRLKYFTNKRDQKFHIYTRPKPFFADKFVKPRCTRCDGVVNDGVSLDEVDVYAVEPNPVQTPILQSFFNNFSYVKGMFVERGVWNETTKLEFGLLGCEVPFRKSKIALKQRNLRDGLKYVDGKVIVKKNELLHTGDPQHDYTAFSKVKNRNCVQTVQVLDVCHLLSVLIGVTADDYVAVKLDVEEAEFPVLDRIYSNCSELIDVIAFERDGVGKRKYVEKFEKRMIYLPWT